MVKNILSYIVIAIAFYYAFFVVPASEDMTDIINGTIYATYGVLALSLALIWGYGGILSFGQAAFFGIGGYVYAIAGLNIGDTVSAAFIAVAAATLFALVLGYFMFWGRLSDVYLGVITLTVSLILFRFLNQTAGDEWKIGVAPLGGFNGIPSTPILAPPGDPDNALMPEDIYLVGMGALFAAYFFCRILLASRFGKVVVAIRENESRAELLGYDARLYKLGIFACSGALAGVAGVLFANCVLVSPNMFNLQTNGQLIIWVIVGGLGTCAGPVIGCFLMLMLSTSLGTIGQGTASYADPNLIMGVLLTLFVILLPKGLLPLISSLYDRLEQRLGKAISARRLVVPLARSTTDSGARP